MKTLGGTTYSDSPGINHVVEVEAILPGVNIIVTDIPTRVVIPALSRAVMTVGKNTVADIEKSKILADAGRLGQIRTYLDGVLVGNPTGVAQVTQPTFSSDPKVIEIEGTKPGVNLFINDIPTHVVIPALSRANMIVGKNTVADVKASAILKTACRNEQIRVYYDGVLLSSCSLLYEAEAPTIPAATPGASAGGGTTVQPPPAPTSENVYNEIPTGIIDGVNSFFSLVFAPFPQKSLMLYRNGILLKQGTDGDYQLVSPTKIQFFAGGSIPVADDSLLASYVYVP